MTLDGVARSRGATRLLGIVAALLSLGVAPSSADIIDGAPAIDLLGQYDQTSFTNPVPSYIKGGPNDYPSLLGLYDPQGLALDSTHHRLFVADSGGARVLVFNLNSSDQLLDRLPDNVLGQGDFATDFYVTDESHLSYPQGLAYSPSQNLLYVADSLHGRVLVFDVATITNGEAAINVLGKSTFTQTNNDPGQAHDLNSPWGVALDDAGHRLFVADSEDNRVLVFDVAAIANGEAPIAVLGQANFETLDAPNPPTAASLSSPRGLAFDPATGRLFVADTLNSRVLVFDVSSLASGMSAARVICQGDFTSNLTSTTDTTCRYPLGVAYDTTRARLYVADSYNHRVTVYTAGAAALINGMAATHVLGQDTLTDSSTAELSYPGCPLVRGSDGALVVADSSDNRLVFYDAAIVTDGEDPTDLLGQYDDTSFTEPVPDFSKYGSGNGPNRFGFSSPSAVALDTAHHRLFVADRDNNRVLVFTLDGSNQVASRVPSAVLGYDSLIDKGIFPPTATGFFSPRGLAYDSANDRLFVSDFRNQRILVFDTQLITNNEPAVHVLGQPDFESNGGGLTAARFGGADDGPLGLAYDQTRSLLYVGDPDNNRVLVFDVATIVDGEPAIHVLGQPNFTSSASGVTGVTFDEPRGVAIDATQQRLFVNDRNNSRIMVFDVNAITNGEAAVGVLCQPDFVSNAEGLSSTACRYPSESLFDAASGRLFVADDFNDRVLVFDATTVSNGEAAVHVFGAADFDSSGEFSPSRTAARFPGGFAFDPGNKRLWVTSLQHNRIAAFPTEYDITYSASDFPEAAANNGSITATAEITLLNEEFSVTSGTLTRSVHYTISGVPAGLVEVITVTSPTTAVVSFTGTAASHALADSVPAMPLSFLDAAFANLTASQLPNSSKSFTVTFNDQPTATPTNTPTATPTNIPTNTPTATPTNTPTATPTPVAPPVVSTPTPLAACFGGNLPAPVVKITRRNATVTLPSGVEPSAGCEITLRAVRSKPPGAKGRTVRMSGAKGVFKKLLPGTWRFFYSVTTVALASSQESESKSSKVKK